MMSDTYKLIRETLIAWKGTPSYDGSCTDWLVSMCWDDGSAAAVRWGAASAKPWARLAFDGQVFLCVGESPEAALMHAFVELAGYVKAKAALCASEADQALRCCKAISMEPTA